MCRDIFLEMSKHIAGSAGPGGATDAASTGSGGSSRRLAVYCFRVVLIWIGPLGVLSNTILSIRPGAV